MLEGTGIYFWLILLVFFIVYVTVKVSIGCLLPRAKEKAWKAYIPFYTTKVLVDLLELNSKVFYMSLIPFVNLYYYNIIIKKLLEGFAQDPNESISYILIPMYKFPELAFKKPHFVANEYDLTEGFLETQNLLFEKSADELPDKINLINPNERLNDNIGDDTVNNEFNQLNVSENTSFNQNLSSVENDPNTGVFTNQMPNEQNSVMPIGDSTNYGINFNAYPSEQNNIVYPNQMTDNGNFNVIEPITQNNVNYETNSNVYQNEQTNSYNGVNYPNQMPETGNFNVIEPVQNQVPETGNFNIIEPVIQNNNETSIFDNITVPTNDVPESPKKTFVQSMDTNFENNTVNEGDSVFTNQSLVPDERHETIVEVPKEQPKEEKPIITPVDKGRPQLCPNCGARLAHGATTCFLCGHKLD